MILFSITVDQEVVRLGTERFEFLAPDLASALALKAWFSNNPIYTIVDADWMEQESYEALEKAILERSRFSSIHSKEMNLLYRQQRSLLQDLTDEPTNTNPLVLTP